MRILSIAGKNIASLAEPFHIDLSAEPLSSAGLFAIVGDTGAGKSSILDALCLALYGSCPRLSSPGADGAVPEAAQTAMASSDPRTCLRRGASEGQAVVTFVGSDGQAYRATWTARRARGKASGKLQDVSRLLERLDDGQAVASGIREVKEAVEARTGLSYDEFRRTVLLAQGEFDAFLRASTRDRAVILEKITGTEVYRAISRRVHEQDRSARQAVDRLRTRLADQPVLDEGQREALAAERDAILTALRDTADVAAGVERDLARHAAIAAARARVAEAEAALVAAEAALETLADERAMLAALRQVEPLRADFALAEARRSGLDAAVAARRAAEARLADATAAEAGARERLDGAEAVWKACTDALLHWRPLWDEAAALDAQADVARRELEAATEAFTSADTLARTSSAATGLAAARFERLQLALAEAQAEAERVAPLQRLAERWEDLQGKLDKREGFRRAGLALDARILRLGDEQDRLQRNQEEAGRLLAAVADERTVLAANLEEHRQALATLDEDNLGQGARRLERWTEGLRRLDGIAAAFGGAQRDETAQIAAATSAGAEGKAVQAELASAETAKQRAEITIQALTGPLARAEDGASKAAAHFRTRLVAREPCPVCGALDHPVRADEAWAAMAADLAAQVAAAEAARATAAGAVADTSRRLASAQARQGQAHAAAEAARGRMEVQAGLFTTARAEIQDCAPDGVAVPVDPVQQDELATLLDQARSDRDTIADKLATVARLRRDMDRLRLEREGVEARLDAGRTAQSARERLLSSLQTDLHLARQEREQTQERLLSLDHEMAEWIAPAAVSPAMLDADFEGARDRLGGAVARFRRAGEARAAAEGAVADARGNFTRAQEDERAACAMLEQANANLTGRREARDRVLQARCECLDGEATALHRARFEEEARKAAAAREASSNTFAAATAGLAAAREGLAQSNRHESEAQEAHRLAHDALERGLGSTGLSRGAALPLLAMDETAREALQTCVQEADHAGQVAAAALADRRQHLAQVEAEGVPAEPAEQLAARRDVLAQTLRDRQVRLGGVEAALQADDEARLRLSHLAQELDAASAAAEVWNAVEAAIGSETGDRFARFAQGVTLDLLVDLANAQLASLKPRYRLARSGPDLGLLVIDKDMADEPRSPVSLSGGERFLVSLALALALSGLGRRQSFVDTLFIDEGFGSLDGESLDLAIDALETLQSQGRSVGVISHVEAMKERIPVQVRVTRLGAGRSRVAVHAPHDRRADSAGTRAPA